MRHDETWKLETEPRQNVQVSRLNQDRNMKNRVSIQSRDNTRVSRLRHCVYIRVAALLSLRPLHSELVIKSMKSSLLQPELECGPMPNVMVALPIIDGALCSTPQSLADAHYLTVVQ